MHSPTVATKKKGPISHRQVSMGHKHGEVGEMAAGARSVRFIPGDELAALRGPVPRHAPLRVVPEGAVGVVVVLCLENNAKTKL